MELSTNYWLEQVAQHHKEWVKIANLYKVDDYAEDIVQEVYIALWKYADADKIIDVKSSEKNIINTQLQTSFYTDNPKKFYIFVTNTKKKDIKLRIVSSQILRQINLGHDIFNELNTYQYSSTLNKEIEKGLKTLDFKHFITTSITQGKSADTTKSFKVGNDTRVRFVIYIEPK